MSLTMHRIALPLCFSALLSVGNGAYAIDTISLETGVSAKSPETRLVRLAIQSDWERPWFEGARLRGTGHWDFSAAQWSTRVGGRRDEIYNFGITPVFRIQSAQPGAWAPYAEAGLGVHYLSDREIYTGRRFGTNLQFGTHIGVGIRFGSQGQFDLSYRIQHLSNAGIRGPNPGIDFHLIRLQMAL